MVKHTRVGTQLNVCFSCLLSAAIEDVDAVVCTLGGSSQDPRVDSEVWCWCCSNYNNCEHTASMLPIECSAQHAHDRCCMAIFLHDCCLPDHMVQGNINIINAAMKKGVKKFILVTSLGCGNSKEAIGPVSMGPWIGSLRFPTVV